MECLAYSIAQIGPNQLGRLEVPSIFPITKWDNYEIVAAESGDTVACRKGTVSIERKTETVVWVEDPLIKLILHVRAPTPRYTSGLSKIRHFGSAAKSESDPSLGTEVTSCALAMLGYVFLAQRYWFSVPFRGVCLLNGPLGGRTHYSRGLTTRVHVARGICGSACEAQATRQARR